MLVKKITCSLPPDTYEIEISHGLLQNPIKLIQDLQSLDSIKSCSAFVIISDTLVKPLYADSLAKACKDLGLHIVQLTFPAGEINKTRSTKEQLEDQMLENAVGADTCLIAIGGGVTTDLAGFIASTYCRGIPLVLIPTSLLSMVDASIGGKNGVNTPFGKNLIGTTTEPKKVIIDFETLKTMKPKDLRDGFVEIIKHALISSSTFFEYLEEHPTKLLSLDLLHLDNLIAESCLIKVKIVLEDQQIKGKRNLLNFGHTIGHALENLTNYSLSHGEAVAIGILVESYMAFKLDIFDYPSIERIKNLFLKYGLPLKLQKKLPIDDLLHAMVFDKKSVKKRARFVIIEQIGTCLECDFHYCKAVDEAFLIDALNWMNQEFVEL